MSESGKKMIIHNRVIKKQDRSRLQGLLMRFLRNVNGCERVFDRRKHERRIQH